MTTIDRRIIWVLLIVLLAIALWLLLDYMLFPPLPVPAGTPSIMK